jgi:hypothetical protein
VDVLRGALIKVLPFYMHILNCGTTLSEANTNMCDCEKSKEFAAFTPQLSMVQYSIEITVVK